MAGLPTPTGPAGWRQLGLLVLLAISAVLLVGRGCTPESAGAQTLRDRGAAQTFRTDRADGVPMAEAAVARHRP